METDQGSDRDTQKEKEKEREGEKKVKNERKGGRNLGVDYGKRERRGQVMRWTGGERGKRRDSGADVLYMSNIQVGGNGNVKE